MSLSNSSVDERTSLTSTNKFELLLFRLGGASAEDDQHELFGINVFKVREMIPMPTITPIPGASEYVLGAVDIRGQIIPVIDLPRLMGCVPSRGLNILLVTEFARSTQAFALEEVDDIVRLEWKQVMAVDGSTGGKRVSSLARITADAENSPLAQVVDVEQVLRDVFPARHTPEITDEVGDAIKLPPGAQILAADDSPFARQMIEHGLQSMELPYTMTKTGLEAWRALEGIAKTAQSKGLRTRDLVALVLTDLEMPEMDGFTLTRQIKADPRMADIPVVIHSSLTGEANEMHVRNAGASGYVAKFAAAELAVAIRKALGV